MINLNWQKHWRRLFQLGAWVLGIIGSFVLPVPLWDYREDKVWFHLAHFVVAALLGLMFVLTEEWTSRRFRWRWWTLSLLLLVGGIAAVFSYQSLRANWTCDYDAQRIVSGNKYTQDVLEYRDKFRRENGRDLSDGELVMHYGGDVEKIWPAANLRQRRLLLAGIYLFAIAAFTLCIITLIQAIHSAKQAK